MAEDPLTRYMRVGKVIFVKYDGDQYYHERFLLAEVEDMNKSRTKWIILTPDDDMYLEDFGADNEDIEEIVYGKEDSSVPRSKGPIAPPAWRNTGTLSISRQPRCP